MFDLSILTFVRQLRESVCVKPKWSCTILPLPSFSISNSKMEVVLSLGESLHWAPLYRNWPLHHQSPAEDCRRRVTFWLRYFASDNMQIPARRHELSRQTLFLLSLPFALSHRSVTRRVMLSITLWHLYAFSDCGGVLIKAHHFLSCGLVSARNQTSQTCMETTLSVISSNKHTVYIHMFPLCIWMHCCLRGIS